MCVCVCVCVRACARVRARLSCSHQVSRKGACDIEAKAAEWGIHVRTLDQMQAHFDKHRHLLEPSLAHTHLVVRHVTYKILV